MPSKSPVVIVIVRGRRSPHGFDIAISHVSRRRLETFMILLLVALLVPGDATLSFVVKSKEGKNHEPQPERRKDPLHPVEQ